MDVVRRELTGCLRFEMTDDHLRVAVVTAQNQVRVVVADAAGATEILRIRAGACKAGCNGDSFSMVETYGWKFKRLLCCATKCSIVWILCVIARIVDLCCRAELVQFPGTNEIRP